MSDKTDPDSNKDNSDTSVENENNQSSNAGDLSNVGSESRTQFENLNATPEHQRMPTASSEDIGHKRNRETADIDSIKNQPTGTKPQKGERFNTVETPVDEAESLVPTAIRVSVIRHTRDVPPYTSCPPENPNATPELHDAVEDSAQGGCSSNVSGDLAVAGPSRYVCDVCNRSFTFKSSLHRHGFLHTGEKRFSCLICNHQFSQKGNLKRHMVTHSKRKDYKCDQCHECFTRKDTLNKHYRIKHP